MGDEIRVEIAMTLIAYDTLPAEVGTDEQDRLYPH